MPQEILDFEPDSEDEVVPDDTNSRRKPTAWLYKRLSVLKWVDDSLIIEKLNFELTMLNAFRRRMEKCVRAKNAVRRIVNEAISHEKKSYLLLQ